LQSQWYYANTFLPLKEENLYITAKMTQKWLVQKCLRGSYSSAGNPQFTDATIDCDWTVALK